MDSKDNSLQNEPFLKNHDEKDRPSSPLLESRTESAFHNFNEASETQSQHFVLNNSASNAQDQTEVAVIAPDNLKTAIKETLLNSIPLVIIFFLYYSIRNLSLHLVASADDENLTNAIGIGNSLINIISMSLFYSFNVGLTTCCAQAYGAKNFQLLGYYLHRGFIINTLMLIPAIILLMFTDHLAIALGFDEATAAYVQRMTSWGSIGVFFFMIYVTLTAYLSACEIFTMPAVVMVLSSLVYWGSSILFVNHFDMGLDGIIISINIMQILDAILLFLYILIKKPVPGSFFWFKAPSFTGIWKLFKYEFFVGSMVFLEWICYEIIYMFSGGLDIEQVSAYTVAMTSYQIWYCLPLALIETLLAFIGSAMGESNIRKAKNFLKAGLILSAGSWVLVEAFYFAFPRASVVFYTDDPGVIKATLPLLKVIQLVYPGDFSQMILSSGLRAVGKEKIGSLVFAICLYAIGIPMAYILTFVMDMEAKGLFLGPIIAIYFLLLWLLYIYWRMNWNKQVQIVLRRLKKDNKGLLPDDETATR